MSSWVGTAAATALAVGVAVPIIYYRWQYSIKSQEREDALKLLRKVELIVAEVTVRLTHMENQAEDLVANEASPAQDGDDAAAADGGEGESQSTLNSYYHFDSQGNKLKTKWDTYDVDAELEKLDEDESSTSAASSALASVSRIAPKKPTATMDKSKLLTAVAGIEREFEAVLEFLDNVRGDETVKAARKTIASRITKEQFSRIDQLRKLLA